MKLRYVFAVISSIGMAIIYGLKVNLSVAIVAMINHTAVVRHTTDNDTIDMSLDDACQHPLEDYGVSTSCLTKRLK